MKLKDILIATVQGGVFHIEDAIFQTDTGSFVKGITTLLEKLKKSKKIRHDYYVQIKSEESSTQAVLEVKCLGNDKITMQVRNNAIVFQLGAIVKQRSLFSPTSYLSEMSLLITEILKYRKAKKINTMGLLPQFLVPFIDKVATKHLKDILFPDIDKRIGLNGFDVFDKLEFGSSSTYKDIETITAVTTQANESDVVIKMDFRADTGLRSYKAFVTKVKPLYNDICNTLVSKFVELDGLDEKLLKTNKTD